MKIAQFGYPLIIGSAMFGIAATGTAADLPARRAPPIYAPPPPIPVFTWSGFYFGANAGYVFDAGQQSRISADNGLEINVLDGIRPAGGSLRSDGFTGGGQIGYNYQIDNSFLFGGSPFGGAGGGIVLGVEADAAYTDVDRGAVYVSNRVSAFTTRTDFVGTVRGRLGYAFGRVLVYGTGGFAYGDVRSVSNFYAPAGALVYAGAADTLRTGVAYGGGVEFAVPTQSVLNLFRSSAVTVKVEYLRYELGPFGLPISALNGGAGYSQTARATGNIVRAGINYKFGLGSLPATPVVARY